MTCNQCQAELAEVRQSIRKNVLKKKKKEKEEKQKGISRDWNQNLLSVN